MMNQDQLVDTFSFLASQQGLYISDIAITPQTTDILILGEETIDPTIVIDRSVHPKKIAFTGIVSGSYENIKSFFQKINHTNRFHELQSFSIFEKSVTESEVKTPTGELEGTFSVVYGYLPSRPVASALDIPFFKDMSFDLIGTAKNVPSDLTKIPSLELGKSGKSNPFK